MSTVKVLHWTWDYYNTYVVVFSDWTLQEIVRHISCDIGESLDKTRGLKKKTFSGFLNHIKFGENYHAFTENVPHFPDGSHKTSSFLIPGAARNYLRWMSPVISISIPSKTTTLALFDMKGCVLFLCKIFVTNCSTCSCRNFLSVDLYVVSSTTASTSHFIDIIS